MADIVELSVPKSNSKILVNTGLFINNEFVPSVENLDRIKYALCLDHSYINSLATQYHRVYNPSTEEVICTVTAGNYPPFSCFYRNSSHYMVQPLRRMSTLLLQPHGKPSAKLGGRMSPALSVRG
jgi:hypothetical protein